jgi:hypothetical protein
MLYLKRLVPLFVLFLLPVLFLWRLTLGGRILVGLDAFNFFYPYHDAVAASLRAGRLPEWNPALFGGVPFLADSQAQLFYPLGWPFLLLDAPTALAWSIVLHLGIAALGTYTWARSALGLGPWGAWVAAAIFALGGYLGAQVEHVNQVQAAAWLPWLLLGYDLARRPGIGWTGRGQGVTLGALALGLSFLAGHAQTTFISLVMLGLWMLRSILRDILQIDRKARSSRANWSGRALASLLAVAFLPLIGIVLIGALLGAIQLIPTQHLSGLSPRAGGLSLREVAAFSLDPRILPRALLPTFGQDAPLLSEYVGWIGFTGLLLAMLGIVGRTTRAARDAGVLAAGAGLFLAFGGYNPVFWLLWRFVPGFDLFRAPARWLLLWALGVAILAGAGVEWLRARNSLPVVVTRDTRVRLIVIGTGALALVGLAMLFASWPEPRVLPWWVLAVCLSVLTVASRPFWPRAWPVSHAALVVAVLLGELWLASAGLDHSQATAPEAYLALRPAPAHLLSMQSPLGMARLLSMSDLTWDPGDLVQLQSRHAGLLSEEPVYDLVVATKLKEVLAPNQPMRWGLQTADGYGGGLLPTARWVQFQPLLPLARVVPDGRLREQLTGLPRRALLDVMGVEWLVADKIHDWWSEGIYHDLGAPLRLEAGDTAAWEVEMSEATALSFVVVGDWPDAPGDVIIGDRQLALQDAAERGVRETARGTERHFLLSIEPAVPLAQIVLASRDSWILGGLSVLDTRLPAFEPLPADPWLRATFSGDVKVYQRLNAPGRAWVVPDPVPVATLDEAAARLDDPAFRPEQAVVVERPAGSWLPVGGAGQVSWLRDDPGHLALLVDAPDGGWLVVADAPFPGWQAELDGDTVEWLPANMINRALYLPPGSHMVEWRFSTPGLGAGALATLAGAILAGAASASTVVFGRSSRARSQSE